MCLRLLLSMFLILAVFMRAMPHEAESGQDTTYRHPPAPAIHKTILGKFIHRRILSPKITSIDFDQEFLENKPKVYYPMEGKIIRNIKIRILDPFGYSLEDTTLVPMQFTKKAGNTLHIKTKQEVIKNLILIRVHQPFDSLLFKESVRLVRAQKYVQDVKTFISPVLPNQDSIDIQIRVIDIWSIIPSWSIIGNSSQAGLTDNNFMGQGNKLQVDASFGKSIHGIISQWAYTVSNISKSHISANIQYYFSGQNDLTVNKDIRKPTYSPLTNNLATLNLSNRYLVRSFELNRSFFSPLARWAGGIFIGRLPTSQSYIEKDSVRYLSSPTDIQDFWAAFCWPLSAIYSKAARTSGLVISARILRTRYPGAVPVTKTTNLFPNENFYLAGIGITSRKFIQDRYVFNYGKIEDIAVGRSFGITAGYLSQNSNPFYLGLKAAWGDNYAFGYLSSYLEYGTFIGSGGFTQQVISARANYYTPLFNAGYWRIRQFIKPSVIVGIDRLLTDNLTPGSIMEGIEGLKIPATRMMALTLQTQSYAPWEIYGFRFGPYFFSSVGIFSNSDSNTHSHLYSALGLGVLIKNNYLLINTFQLSFTFYPFLPQQGHPALEFNAYKTTDYGLGDFEISKPQVVEFR